MTKFLWLQSESAVIRSEFEYEQNTWIRNSTVYTIRIWPEKLDPDLQRIPDWLIAEASARLNVNIKKSFVDLVGMVKKKYGQKFEPEPQKVK